MNKQKLWKTLFPILAAFALNPSVSSAQALVTGLVLSLVFGNPWLDQTKKYTPKLLAYSVVGLGAGMDLDVVAEVGASGIGYTIVGISFTLFLGWLLGRVIKVNPDCTSLISVGTAICGGSAIAAVSPVIRAKSQDVSVSLVVVFLLNALALVIFPWLGHHFHLSESQFGFLSALAIHDTSSVVGSASAFGPKSLEIATTVKLTRALWIIPVALCFAFLEKLKATGKSDAKLKKPWFILGFLLMAAAVTYIPEFKAAGATLYILAKRLLVLTLFFIGSNVPRTALKEVGVKPLILGVTLWGIVTVSTLSAILAGWIH